MRDEIPISWYFELADIGVYRRSPQIEIECCRLSVVGFITPNVELGRIKYH